MRNITIVGNLQCLNAIVDPVFWHVWMDEQIHVREIYNDKIMMIWSLDNWIMAKWNVIIALY